jgi:hypothetical protein
MAELQDVYGTNYLDESKQCKSNHVINHIANNIANKQFNFRLFESDDIWDASHNLPPQVIETLIKKVRTINKQICLVYLDKKSDSINMLPELIIDSPVEYFWIIDGETHKAYFIYITPHEVGAY